MIVAFLVQNPFYNSIKEGKMDGGLYNGCVAFDCNLLPSYMETGYNYQGDVIDNYLKVHGGITIDTSMERFSNMPIIPLTALPSPEELYKYRVIGFDTFHAGDTKEYWTIEKIKIETMSLFEQVELNQTMLSK